jgi:molecular chaperone GrpE
MPADETIINQAAADTEPAGQAASDGAAESAEVSTAEEELAAKLTEMQDRYLRLSAEFDNYRKRTLREKIELAQSGGERVIVSLLPIIDDFDRAMTSMHTTDDYGAVKVGLELIYSKINDFLRQNGVKEITVVNEPFNSDLHEAVTSVAVEDESLRGKVIEVTQKGYSLNEKVIRFPKVVVGE